MASITIKSCIYEFESKAWSYYVAIPKDIASELISGEDRRVMCSLNGNEPMHSALMPKDDIFTIYVKKEFLKKNALSLGDEVEVALKKDLSPYGTEVPESFEEILKQDLQGEKLFHELNKSNQRLLIQLVNKVKNLDSQISKSLAIMHHLKEKDGILDFKELNQTIKAFNSRNSVG